MSDLYKIGITLALTNQVSKGLGLIARDLAKTDAQAIKLRKTLHSMEKLAIGGAITGGVGLALLKPFEAGYDAAKRYEQALNQFKALNLGDAVNRDADKFARGSHVMGASATDLIGTVRDLHTALGEYDMAKALGAQVSQMKWANQAIFGAHGMDFSERQLQAMEKIVEMKGGFHGTQQFLAQADMMQKVISGTGGMVKPSDYLQFIKTAGVSGRLLSNESFYYAMEPLIQELSGGRVGTGTMSAYNNLAQGKSTVRAANEMMRLGILDPKLVEYTKIGTVKQIKPGALTGMDQYTSDPYRWMQDVLLPAMAKKGITSEKDVLNELGAIFGNRSGSNLFSLMFLQQDKIGKNMAISKNALGVDSLVKLAKSSPQGAEAALGAEWENLKNTFGHVVIPIILPQMERLRLGLEAFGRWAEAHPVKLKWLTLGFLALGSAMAFGGTVMLLRAGFMGLSAVMGMGGVTGNVLRLTGTLTPLGLALGGVAAAAAGIIVYHKEIADWIDSHEWGRKIGDNMLAAKEWFSEGDGSLNGVKNVRVPPPPANNTKTAYVSVNVEGRQILRAIAPLADKETNRPQASPQMFNTRQSPAHAGATGTY